MRKDIAKETYIEAQRQFALLRGRAITPEYAIVSIDYREILIKQNQGYKLSFNRPNVEIFMGLRVLVDTNLEGVQVRIK